MKNKMENDLKSTKKQTPSIKFVISLVAIAGLSIGVLTFNGTFSVAMRIFG